MKKNVDVILEDVFGIRAEEVRQTESGAYSGIGNVWLSPALVAEIADRAYEHGRWNPPSGYSLMAFPSNDNGTMSLNDIEGDF